MVRAIGCVIVLLVGCGDDDAPADAGNDDATVRDSGVDAGPDDAGPPDAGIDAGADDAGAADTGVAIDSGPPDAGAPDAGPTPCRAEIAHTYAEDMVLCGPGELKGGADQCVAESVFCGPGWTLCTASQFLARGGTTDPAPYAAWVAGCMRESGGAVTTPADGICTCAPGARASLELVGLGCDGSTEYRTDSANIGVVASPGCFAAGPSGVGPMARWQPMPSTAAWSGGVCCR